MWTAKNRGRYDRSKLRYPNDLSDDEWALVEPLIPPASREHGGREASPTAAIIDSQSVKSAEKGGAVSIRMAMMRARRSKARSVTFS